MREEIISSLIKASKAVYLATEERAADDLAELMLQAAVCIKDLETERTKVAEIEAKNKVMREELIQASKRSSYSWSRGSEYTSEDWKNEGKIELAQQALEATKEERKERSFFPPKNEPKAGDVLVDEDGIIGVKGKSYIVK